ncbi:MAG: type II toxin-antitoxin system HicA family toxin [Fibrobacterota bacterium]
MSRLPVVSGRDLCKAMGNIGYLVDHQTGSHIILRHNTPPFRRLTIPNHREIAKGTLRAIIKQAGISVDEFRRLV